VTTRPLRGAGGQTPTTTRYVAVVGPGEATAAELALAEEIGARLVDLGAAVVTGGLGGVMEAACRGAKSRLGLTIGLLPGLDRGEANGWVDVAIATGLGELRNGLLVRTSDALVAIGGGAGTLSEIGFALKIGRPVIGLGTFTAEGVVQASSAAEAAALAFR
jgi:uncharacterized protein (TIGR00725 family)